MKYYNSTDFKFQALSSQQKQEEVAGEIAEDMTREKILNTDFPSYIMKYAGFDEEAITQSNTFLSNDLQLRIKSMFFNVSSALFVSCCATYITPVL